MSTETIITDPTTQVQVLVHSIRFAIPTLQVLATTHKDTPTEAVCRNLERDLRSALEEIGR